jgi:hypothetical protein
MSQRRTKRAEMDALESCRRNKALWLARVNTVKQVVHHSRYVVYEVFFFATASLSVWQYLKAKLGY